MSIDAFLKSPEAGVARAEVFAPAAPAAPTPPAEGPGVSDYLSVGLRGLARAPGAAVASTISAVQGQAGVDAPGQGDFLEEKVVRPVAADLNEFEQGVAQQFPDSTGIQTLSRLPRQLGFSAPSTVAGIGAGVATAAATANPVAPFLAGGAVSGGVAYRTSSADIMRSYIDTLDEEKRAGGGTGLTLEEVEQAKADFGAKATQTGLWEALPEAVGGAVAGRLVFGPIKKMVGEKVARTMLGKLGAVAGTLGEELATETVTEIGQNQTLRGSLLEAPEQLDFTPAGALTALKSVAPDVLLMTAVLGGGAKLGQSLYQRKQERQLASRLGVDKATLRSRINEVMTFKAANPDAVVSKEQINQFLAGAVTLDGQSTEALEAQAAATPLAPAGQDISDTEAADALNLTTTQGGTDGLSTLPSPGDEVRQEVQGLRAEGAPVGDRRENVSLRERIASMSPEEIEKELYTSGRTGLPNRRAYDEAPKMPATASLDLDGLKWVNDNLSHQHGDALIEAVGMALAELTPDGTVITKQGVEFGHGIGSNLATAEEALKTAKANSPTRRGSEPAGVVRVPAPGGNLEGNTAQGQGQEVAPPVSDPIANLTEIISREIGQPVAAGTFAAVKPPSAVFAKLEKVLGKKVVFFSAKNSPVAFDGVTRKDGVLYVNIKSSRPHMVVVGHEFLHELKLDDPAAYDRLLIAVRDVMPESIRMATWTKLNDKRVREGRAEISLEAVEEELVADFFGAQFGKRSFWEKVEAANPEGFAGLVQRFIDFIESVKQAFEGPQLRDMQRAQDVAAEVLAQYQKRAAAPASAVGVQGSFAEATEKTFTPKELVTLTRSLGLADSVALELPPAFSVPDSFDLWDDSAKRSAIEEARRAYALQRTNKAAAAKEAEDAAKRRRAEYDRVSRQRKDAVGPDFETERQRGVRGDSGPAPRRDGLRNSPAGATYLELITFNAHSSPAFFASVVGQYRNTPEGIEEINTLIAAAQKLGYEVRGLADLQKAVAAEAAAETSGASFADTQGTTLEDLQRTVADLETRTDAAYEAGDVELADSLDADLAEARADLDNFAAQDVYEEGQDATSDVSIEEQLAHGYANILRLRRGDSFSGGFASEEDVISNMRDALASTPGPTGLRTDITDAEVLAAAEDAYNYRRRNTSFAEAGSAPQDPSAAEAEEVQAGVEGKTIAESAQFLIDKAPTADYKLVADKVRSTLRRLAAAGVKFNLNVAHVGGSVPSLLVNARGVSSTYFEEQPRVEVWLNGADVTGKVGVSYETALHELVHAATQGAVHIGARKVGQNTPVARAVTDLYTTTNQIIAHLNRRAAASKSGEATLTDFEQRILKGGTNMLQTPDEVLAYTLTNKEMQAYLETIEVEKQTLWSAFVEAVRTLLGLDVSANTALSKVLQAGGEILDAPVEQIVVALKALGGSLDIQTPSGQVTNMRASFADALDGISRTSAKSLKSIVQGLKAGSFKLQALLSVFKVTPESVMVEVYKDRIPLLSRLYSLRRQRDALRNEIIDNAAVNYQRIVDLAKKGVGVKAVENTAALASFYQVHAQLPLMEQDWVPATGTTEERLKVAQRAWEKAGMDVSTDLSFRDAYRKSRDAFTALKSKDLQDAYLEAATSMKELRQREQDNMQRIIEQATENNPELRAELLNKLEATFGGLKGTYWPLYREGNFRLEYMDGDTRVVEHFESDFERQQVKAALVEGGVEAETFRESYMDKTPPAMAAIPAQLMDQLSASVEKSFIAKAGATDAAEIAAAKARAADTIRDMTEIWLRWQPETSALKNSIKRRNVKGFSLNMLRGYLRYSQAHGSRIAQLEVGRTVEDTLAEIATDIKGRTGDTTVEGMVLNDMREREAAGKTIHVNKAAALTGKVTTFWYMTSPSIALVQMTQLGVLTLPKLAVMFSPTKAVAALTQGLNMAFSSKYSRKAMFDDAAVGVVYDDMTATVTPQNREGGRKLGEPLYTPEQLLAKISDMTPYQQRLLALRVAMGRNLLDISLSHEVDEITRGGDPAKPTSKIFKGMMSFMRVSETASRKTAILGTFEAAKSSGKNFFEAIEAVDEVVESTLYNYSKGAKGVLLQGSTARVLLTFQHFRIMTAFKLALLARDSFKGNPAAMKEFVGIMGMSGLLAGTMGMPFISILTKVINSVMGDDDDPYDFESEFEKFLTEAMGETAAQAVVKGPASILGADISRRIGLGDVVGSQDMPVRLHGSGAAAWWATQLLGPSYSMVEGWARGYDEMINKGNYMKGLEAASPKPLKDMLKAYGLAADGLKTGQGKRLMTAEDIGANEVLMMAMGFQPAEVSRIRTDRMRLDNLGTRISQRRGRLVQTFVRDYFDGDSTDAMEAILEYNAKQPTFAIGGADLRSGLTAYMRGDLGVESRRDTLLRLKAQ
jgi:hypothetical protein